MSRQFPALFVSHGAPSMLIEECPTRDFLRHLGERMGRPKAIVCVSAHWTTPEPRVTLHPQPSTIHDFYGFAEELYDLTYPAPGDSALATRLLSLLRSQGIAAEGDLSRGFDHGAWAPLMLMYPGADIPLIQLSVQPQLGPEHHLAVGRALQPLRDEEILVVASGSATHNIQGFFGRELGSEPLPYAREFAQWLSDAVVTGDTNALLDYLNLAPYARKNHPTSEHFLPLFVPLGTGGTGHLVHDSYTYGSLSMAAFSWD
jgi:4,5-DOPA dioxygenase extradiol